VPALQAGHAAAPLTTPINSCRRIPNPRDQLRQRNCPKLASGRRGGGRTKYIWGLSRSVQGQSRHSDRGLAYLGQRTSSEPVGMSQTCQRTKSLRSSPLRGSKSREACSRSRGQRWRGGKVDTISSCIVGVRVHHRDRHQHTIPIALAALSGAILPPTSCLGAFWTPASLVCRDSRRCRRPKTSTLMDSFTAAIARPIRSPHRRDVRVCRVRSQQMPSRPTRSSHRDSDLGRECRLGPIDPSIRAAAA
jgi:hypothetical protein